MTTGQVVFVLCWILGPFVLALGAIYGDYKAGERYMIFWKKKKKDVNSGAKFG